MWSCLRAASANNGGQMGNAVGTKCVCVCVVQQLWGEIRLLEFAEKEHGRHIKQVPMMWP